MRVFAKSLKVTVLAVFAGMMITFGLVAPAVAAVQDNPVLDSAQVFTGTQGEELKDALHAADDKYGLIFVVETVNTTGNQNIEDFANDRANTLGVGSADTDNGVYMLIAKDDRDMWLTVGEGVQSEVSDADIQNTVDTVIIPSFKTEAYLDGVVQGVNRVGEIYSGVYTAPVSEPVDIGPGLAVFGKILLGVAITVAVVWIAIVIIRNVIGRRRKKRDAEKRAAEQRQRFFEEDVWETLVSPDGSYKDFVKAVGSVQREKVVKDTISRVAANRDEQDLTESVNAAATAKRASKRFVQHLYYDAGLKSMTTASNITSKYEDRIASSSLAEVEKDIVRDAKEARKSEVEAEREAAARAAAAKAEKAKQEAQQKKEAKKLWSSLSSEDKKRVRSARTNREKQNIIAPYNTSGIDTNILFPVLVGLYVAEIGYPSSAAASARSSSSSYSSGSSSSYSSSSSDFSSFSGGGGFDGGGGGSW